MNSTNLGTQPEHKILFVRDLLHDAAYRYGEDCASLRSAISCGMPRNITDQLTRNMREALVNLEESAIQYFDNVYDGATE